MCAGSFWLVAATEKSESDYAAEGNLAHDLAEEKIKGFLAKRRGEERFWTHTLGHNPGVKRTVQGVEFIITQEMLNALNVYVELVTKIIEDNQLDDSDVIVEAAISIAIDHEKKDVFTVLVSKSSYSKRLEMLFIQVIKKGKADLALSLYEMGAYKDQPKKMANELLDATVFNEQVKNFTLRKIFDLLPKDLFMGKISEIRTKKQLSSLFACSSVNPLEVSLLVASDELRDACIDMFKLYKTQLYKKRDSTDVELIQSLLVNSDIPSSIVKKLARYHIENEFDLSMYANEEVLRNLVGLQRVEINEILYFLEDRSFELQASDLLVEFDAYIEDLELSTRTKKLLIAEGLFTIRELVQLTESDLRMVPGLGNKSIEEITMMLKINNLSLDGAPL
jgi:hypothetical protein